MPLLFLCYLGSYLCRINVGFAKQAMQAELGFSDAVYGFGAGVFFLGFLALEIPSNALLIRIGARRTFSRVIVLWSLASGSMAFIEGASSFYLLRFALGAAEAGFSAGILYYIGLWFPGPIRARAIAVLTCSAMVGGALGGPTSGLILDRLDGLWGLAGWRWMFLLEALPSLLLGITVWCVLTDMPCQASWLTKEERLAMYGAEGSDERVRKPGHHFGDAFRNWRIYVLAFSYFTMTAGVWLISFWLPTFIAELGVHSRTRVGLLTALPYAAGGVFMIVLGRSSDRHEERRWHSAISAAVGALALVASMYAGNAMLSVLLLCVATAGIFSAATILLSIPSTMLRGAAAAAGLAVISVAGGLGGFVSPYAAGVLRMMTGSSVAPVAAVAAVLCLGALVLVLLTPGGRSARRA